MLVELSVMEQRCRTALRVVQDDWKVDETVGSSPHARSLPRPRGDPVELTPAMQDAPSRDDRALGVSSLRSRTSTVRRCR